MRVTLTESTPFATAATPAQGPGRVLVQLITPGWGSSGYYSSQVLQTAARDRVWPAGTHMYIDHPAESEQFDRPERTVKDLAAVLTEDARWDPARDALVAEARVFSHWSGPLSEMSDAIGVSVRGSAEGEMGDVQGRHGRVFTRLIAGESVDFVTRAGRGGKVAGIIESARVTVTEARNVGQWVESRIHRDFTNLADEMFGEGRLTRTERITLSGGIGAALAAFVARIEAEAPDLYERDIWDQAPADNPVAVEATAATFVPVNPAGQSTTQESKEDTMPQIEEARLRQLEEAHGRVPTLTSERDTAVKRAETAEATLAEARDTINAATAVRIVREAFDAAGVNAPKTITRLAEHAPLTKNGLVDESALKTSAQESAAELAESTGAGQVRGFGDTSPHQGDQLTESDIDAAIATAFGHQIKEA